MNDSLCSVAAMDFPVPSPGHVIHSINIKNTDMNGNSFIFDAVLPSFDYLDKTLNQRL